MDSVQMMAKLKERVTRGRWVKNWGEEDGSQHCVLGHLGAIYREEKNLSPYQYHLSTIGNTRSRPARKIIRALAGVIREQYPERLLKWMKGDSRTVMHFNDHKKTTLEDMQRVIEKAQVRLEEEV